MAAFPRLSRGVSTGERDLSVCLFVWLSLLPGCALRSVSCLIAYILSVAAACHIFCPRFTWVDSRHRGQLFDLCLNNTRQLRQLCPSRAWSPGCGEKFTLLSALAGEPKWLQFHTESRVSSHLEWYICMTLSQGPVWFIPSDRYIFSSFADDGARMWLDSASGDSHARSWNLVIDHWDTCCSSFSSEVAVIQPASGESGLVQKHIKYEFHDGEFV